MVNERQNYTPCRIYVNATLRANAKAIRFDTVHFVFIDVSENIMY